MIRNPPAGRATSVPRSTASSPTRGQPEPVDQPGRPAPKVASACPGPLNSMLRPRSEERNGNSYRLHQLAAKYESP
ncbi:hypothetical protein [Streptomyces sp. NPDC088762]|uniref:hypothetical protein n=1 Tax=Streptomyces sp. NPDC088762 TaxID=3365891 RepID=UPI0037FB87F1